ncbi:MAG: hypothetical protein M1147_07595 [Nitrospirae bacterium]|nr:hypothetical protein [Nitrospirota bacterium]MCL5977974.1 hypothetical protein [Nitrospirota bacterium]
MGEWKEYRLKDLTAKIGSGEWGYPAGKWDDLRKIILEGKYGDSRFNGSY